MKSNKKKKEKQQFMLIKTLVFSTQQVPAFRTKKKKTK